MSLLQVCRDRQPDAHRETKHSIYAMEKRHTKYAGTGSAYNIHENA